MIIPISVILNIVDRIVLYDCGIISIPVAATTTTVWKYHQL